MFERIGQFAASHAKAILAVTVLVLIGAGALGFTAFGKLQDGGFTDDAAESTQARALLNQQFGDRANLVFLISANSGTVDDTAVQRAGTDFTNRLSSDPDVKGVTSYFTTQAPTMRSQDGRYALTTAHLVNDSDDAIKDLRERYGDNASGPITVDVGGAQAFNEDARTQIGQDLIVAESIAVPLILLLLVFAFGSLVAAMIPLAIGVIAIFGTFAELAFFGSITDVSVYAINLTTALGLGLAIDYGLLMVSRFREELAAGQNTHDAVITTVATAGRTIVFAATTVAVALSALLLFPLYFLQSFAIAGIGVIAISMVAALLVLPAMLAVLGPRINAGRLPWARKRTPTSVSAFWGRIAGAALRRPVLAGAPVIIVLVVAAIPLLRAEFGNPDDRVLTASVESREVGDALRAQFPGDDSRAIRIVTTGPASQSAVAEYTSRVERVPGVARVVTTPGPSAQMISAVTSAEAISAEAQDVVRAIRTMPAPAGVEVKVGGVAAELVDSKESIGSRLPFAALLIALSTFVLLFLFTGSILQPLRALVFNLFGLAATLGVMVLVFQEGWLSSWLGFTPLPLNINMLVLLFCITFGLSMDYEVFVLSRIKETHDGGADLNQSVTYGLYRTGRIVTTAAALIAVSMFAFGTSGVSFIQLFGIGTGLAILIDATLIRGILVPVGMRLLGNRAWWAPEPLRRLHDRVGLREAPETPEPAKVPV
jgi:putative drug exporter of the RND superfamily